MRLMLTLKYLSKNIGISILVVSLASKTNRVNTSKCCRSMHTKARQTCYPNVEVKRFCVPDEKVCWGVPFPEYKPVTYTSEHILSGPEYADPDISKNPTDCALKFNQLDDGYNVDRTSYTGIYEINNGLPRNPCGRTGITGRGALGRWGPNHAADPIVTRWKHTSDGKKVFKDEKPVLEFVAIKRKDCGQWAIPGGMVEPGDSISNTLKKEFGEEALNAMEASKEEREKLLALVNELFKGGDMIYKGYVDDPRNTDNAWMETIAVNFHDDTGETFDRFFLQAGDDAGAVKWMEIFCGLELYANHIDMIHKVAVMHGAHLPMKSA